MSAMKINPNMAISCMLGSISTKSGTSAFRSAELIDQIALRDARATPAIAWPWPMHIVAIP